MNNKINNISKYVLYLLKKNISNVHKIISSDK